MANTKFESRLSRRTRENLAFQRRLSIIEALAESDPTQPLLETEVETGAVTRELPWITKMMERNPLLTIHRRGGEA